MSGNFQQHLLGTCGWHVSDDRHFLISGNGLPHFDHPFADRKGPVLPGTVSWPHNSPIGVVSASPNGVTSEDFHLPEQHFQHA